MSHTYELYRGSSVGLALADSLDALISSNEITPQLAIRIMERYDRAVCDVFQKQVKAKATFKGHLHTYRNCDDVWTFYARDCTLKMEAGETVTVAKLKIIACKSPQADAADAIKKTPAKDKDKDKDS
ncbi:Transcription initiation factor IIA small chain (TFIIA 13.5 kDa subunit) [Serendipita sp. 411]|nr:Transcription initiation factor IIA small chain (TFIIA 13.5 kDa subunit) [Serendipita sp. 401]KAG8821911.1 Transcription initiation factor IIA small chain (TFIIA 13.5 kDa subunit) [Serendipita sp. 400]KAG8852074.1 Transcription initiation factor IIA small chain (TFIIA 13.5 kDa subunit) [Serendipita sp. 411]KAG9052445.1 Transcription initiation factor IIA small chain (TFIIA 13.5 kDa subunit) [Serendipita sp. 407]